MKLQFWIRQFFQWLGGILFAFIIANIICFAYERQAGWFDTPCGATAAVRQPYSILVHGTEGYSISRMDRNGFTNPDMDLASNYVLMMGASHTQGKEISPNKKYSVLVNDYFYDDGLLHTYNISCDGSFLPSQINHFKAAVEAFPNAEAITIEIMSTDYSINQLEEALDQPEYNESDSAVHFSRLSFMGKLRNSIKSYMPMFSKMKKNKEAFEQAKASKSIFQVDEQEYNRVINEGLALLRSESDKPIVFIYHPAVDIEPDGKLSLKYSSTWEIFKMACNNNGIDIIDSGEDFLDYYYDHKEVPYGFNNTSLGTGHLNEVGHRIIANEIVEYLEELKQ